MLLSVSSGPCLINSCLAPVSLAHTSCSPLVLMKSPAISWPRASLPLLVFSSTYHLLDLISPVVDHLFSFVIFTGSLFHSPRPASSLLFRHLYCVTFQVFIAPDLNHLSAFVIFTGTLFHVPRPGSYLLFRHLYCITFHSPRPGSSLHFRNLYWNAISCPQTWIISSLSSSLLDYYLIAPSPPLSSRAFYVIAIAFTVSITLTVFLAPS